MQTNIRTRFLRCALLKWFAANVRWENLFLSDSRKIDFLIEETSNASWNAPEKKCRNNSANEYTIANIKVDTLFLPCTSEHSPGRNDNVPWFIILLRLIRTIYTLEIEVYSPKNLLRSSEKCSYVIFALHNRFAPPAKFAFRRHDSLLDLRDDRIPLSHTSARVFRFIGLFFKFIADRVSSGILRGRGRGSRAVRGGGAVSVQVIERRNTDPARVQYRGSPTCRGDSVLFVNVRRLHPLSSSSRALYNPSHPFPRPPSSSSSCSTFLLALIARLTNPFTPFARGYVVRSRDGQTVREPFNWTGSHEIVLNSRLVKKEPRFIGF